MATLRDEKTVARYRVRAQDWSRQRTLTFLRVVTLMLTGHKHALQNVLNRFFRAVGLLAEVPTASAYSQACQKVEPALFEHLNTLVVEKFYTLYAPEGGVKRWQGRRVLGIDGTMINLPDTPATRRHYTRHGNQHAGAVRVQALGSVCYDLLNDLALDATLGPQQAEKERVFSSHLKVTAPGDMIILDRGYADYGVMAFLLAHQREFVLRLPRRRAGLIRAFWDGPQRDQVVEFSVPERQRAFVKEHDLTSQLRGLCQLICIDAIINERGRRFRCRFFSGSQRWGRNLPPTLESFLHLLTIGESGESMPVWTEMLGDGSIRRKEPLGMAG